MADCCIKIEISGVTVPPQREGDRVIPYGADMTILEQAPEIGEGGRLKSGGAADIDIPETTFSKWIFEGREGETFDVRVNAHGRELTENRLRYVSKTDRGFECEVERADWRDALKNLQLQDVEGYDIYEIDEDGTFILDNWQNDAEFTGTERGFYLPIVNFGGTVERIEQWELRQIMNVKCLLDRAFCAVGYSFHCPFLDTAHGRRKAYFLSGGERIGNGYAIQTSGRAKFRVEKMVTTETVVSMQTISPTSPIMITGAATLPNVRFYKFSNDQTGLNYDTGEGNGQSVGGFNGYWIGAATGNPPFFVPCLQPKAAGLYKLKCHLVFQSIGVPTECAFTFAAQLPIAGGRAALSMPIGSPFYVRCVDSNAHPNDKKFAKIIHDGGPQDLVVDVEFEVFNSGLPDIAPCAVASLANQFLPLKQGSFIEGEQVKIYLAKDTQYDSLPATSPQIVEIANTIFHPQDWIDPTLTAYQVFEALAHEINGKVVFDNAMRRVSLLTPENTVSHGEKITGFYQKKGQKVTQLCDETLSISGTDKPNTFKVGYDESDDGYIKKLNKGQPYDYVVNFSDPAPTQKRVEKTNRNPLLAPTINGEYFEIKDGANEAISVPFCWESENDNLSGTVKPRSFYCAGLIKQLKSDGSGGFKKYMSVLFDPNAFNKTPESREEFGYAYQHGAGQYTDGTDTFFETENSIVYDENGVAEPLRIFWQKQVLGAYSLLKVSAKIIVKTFHEFQNLDFRAIFNLKINGSPRNFRLASKQTNACDFHVVECEFVEDSVC